MKLFEPTTLRALHGSVNPPQVWPVLLEGDDRYELLDSQLTSGGANAWNRSLVINNRVRQWLTQHIGQESVWEYSYVKHFYGLTDGGWFTEQSQQFANEKAIYFFTKEHAEKFIRTWAVYVRMKAQ